MDINKISKIHMIGIKGVGMSMLAQYLVLQGKKISGSDIPDTFMTDKVLKKLNIDIKEVFDSSNITSDLDLVIFSSAYSPDTNTELKTALDSKIKTISFAEALSSIFNSKHGIAVIGSHGKTTTTAWLGYVMKKSFMDPSVFVGSEVPQFGGLSIYGKSDYMVAEIDEYQNKLKYFQPKMVLLNNIDYDHPDFFPTEDEYKQVFIEFIKKIPSKGVLVANYDDDLIKKFAAVNCQANIITYAINESADYVAYDIKKIGSRQYFKVKLADNDEAENLGELDLGAFSILLSGNHNISNALAVIASSAEMGIELKYIRKYLEEFSGTARRMQILGKFHGATVIDDYAHHPTEIKTTLAGAKELYPDNKLVLVFHPHTFTRTKALLKDFSESFDEVDELIVLDIYGSAREVQGGVHSNDLIKATKEHFEKIEKKIKVSHIPELTGCEEYLRENLTRDDVLILMGAGDVFRIGENLVSQ